MTPLHDHIARLPAAELDRLRAAAYLFESTAPEDVADALPADVWLFETRDAPLVFAWPVDGPDADELLQDVLLGIRPSTGLLLVPNRWLRLATGESARRRRELEAMEALAKAFRDALLRLDEGKP